MTSINRDAEIGNRQSLPRPSGSADELARHLREMAENVRDAFQCILDYCYTNPEENPIEKYTLVRAVVVGTNYIETTYSGSENPFHSLAAFINFLKVIDDAGRMPACGNQYLRELIRRGEETGIIELPDTEFNLDIFNNSMGSSSPALTESYCIMEISRMQKLAGL